MLRLGPVLIWGALAAVVLLPLAVAANSPLLAWRQPVYITASFAGIVALALLLIQPLLAGGYLPGLRVLRGRHLHRYTGAALVLAVLVHVAGLWITSPPDMVDALTFTSPTPFSAWGVIAMWGVFGAAGLAVLRARLSARVWRIGHTGLVVLVLVTSVLHAVLIQGTMGTVTKLLLCACALGATARVMVALRIWRLYRRSARMGRES